MFSISADSILRADVSFSGGTDNYVVTNQSVVNNMRNISVTRPLDTGDQYDFKLVNNTRVHLVWGQSDTDFIGKPMIQGVISGVLFTDQQLCTPLCLRCSGPEESNCLECRPHYHLKDGKCLACPAFCSTCDSQLVCSSCLSGHLLMDPPSSE